MLPTAKAPHPDAATRFRSTAVADAVPPLVGVTLSQEGGAYEPEVATVNGVPPTVADFT
jgi:hypothetical protein